MERGTGEKSAVQEVRDSFGVPVIAVATLDDVMHFIADSPALADKLEAVQRYRDTYGVK
jgi:orotate phosphoribosyltransferase